MSARVAVPHSRGWAGAVRPWLLLLGCALLGGCFGRATRVYPAPTVDALLARIRSHKQALRSMRTNVPPKVDHWSEQGRIKTPVAMLVERPDRLRFDAESPVAGRIVASLTTDGRSFTLLDFDKHTLYEGRPDPCNVARLIRIRLSASAVVDVLLGSSPVPEGLAPTLSWDGEQRQEVLTFALPSGETQLVGLDGSENPPTWDLVRAELRDRSGAVVWRLAHEKFHVVSGLRVPRVTRFEKPSDKADVIIRWKARELNVSLPAAAFQADTVPGLVRQELRCR